MFHGYLKIWRVSTQTCTRSAISNYRFRAISAAACLLPKTSNFSKLVLPFTVAFLHSFGWLYLTRIIRAIRVNFPSIRAIPDHLPLNFLNISSAALQKPVALLQTIAFLTHAHYTIILHSRLSAQQRFSPRFLIHYQLLFRAEFEDVYSLATVMVMPILKWRCIQKRRRWQGCINSLNQADNWKKKCEFTAAVGGVELELFSQGTFFCWD